MVCSVFQMNLYLYLYCITFSEKLFSSGMTALYINTYKRIHITNSTTCKPNVSGRFYFNFISFHAGYKHN